MRFSRLVDAAGNFLELRSLGDLLLLRRSGAFLEGVSFTGASPLTTKGDLLVHNGTSVVRLAVGANSRRFVADSSTTEGVRWATIFSATVTRTAAALSLVLLAALLILNLMWFRLLRRGTAVA